jgi:two-component system, NarL family, invasion response regulator UvrY
MPYVQPRIKLAIVDDHKLFRKGLIELINLKDKDRYLILFEAENGNDLIARLDKKALPDIVLLDINMPAMSGFETVAWLQDHYPHIHILVVSMIEKEEAIIRMLKLGVKGYLSKDIEPNDLHEALRAIMAKGYYYTDFITGKLIHSLRNGTPEATEDGQPILNLEIYKQLNERHREFIKRACSELTYTEIAGQMNLSVKTIDGYRDEVFEKFGIKNRVGLVLFALKNGLASLA